MSNLRLGTLVGGVALALGALAAACGGGGSKEEKLQFDVTKAEIIAHNALIGTNALPGSGWTITNEDPKETAEPPPANSSACKQIDAFQAEGRKFDADHRAGRAKREIQRPMSGAPLPVEVEVEIEIYRRTAGLGDSLTKVRKLVNDGVYASCFSDLLTEAFKGGNITSSTKPATPSVTAPANGFSFAVETELSGAGTPAGLRFENYGWLESNARVTVSFSGPKSAITAELVTAGIEKTKAALASATP